MKKIIGWLMVQSIFAYALTLNALAQSQPRLSIFTQTPNLIQINWTNQIGNSYHVFYTTNLLQPFALMEDAFSPDILVTVYATTADSPVGFFRIQVPTNTASASAQIYSPSNSMTVNGEISIRMGAQLGTQIQGVNLYLDDVLVGYLNSGGMNFAVDTTHFANGAHTVYVGAVDAANNETLSDAITLDFENSVRWLDACSMFNSFVPIDVTSDIFPADWLVTVSDTNGTIVRTITDSTPDGNIHAIWDGTDDNGQQLPVENLYMIQVDVAASGSSSLIMASTVSSSLSSSLGAISVSSQNNSHGVPVYTVVKPAPNPLTAYLQTLSIYNSLTPQEKIIYPPLPPRPASNPNATSTAKISARDMFLAIHHASGTTLKNAAGIATPNAGSSMATGSTKDLVWWENGWSSKQTIVARVPIAGILGITVASDCNQIAELIGAADGTVGNNRGVFGTYVQVVSTSSDVYGLTNQFTDPNVTAFYFYMHGNTNGNVIGTLATGISAKSVASLLQNYYAPALALYYGADAGKQAMVTHKPFNFVFLDGCNTSKGDFPEAFGIPKAVATASFDADYGPHLHKRAFMGWSGPVVFQFDSTHIDWTLDFWSAWLDDSQAYSVQVIDAILKANNDHPGVLSNVPIQRYGSRSLTWSD